MQYLLYLDEVSDCVGNCRYYTLLERFFKSISWPVKIHGSAGGREFAGKLVIIENT